MAVRTEKLTLCDVEYTIHAFNIGELERISDLLEGSPRKVSLGILRIALERAEPPVADPSKIEMTLDDVQAAQDVLLKLAGLKKIETNPPVGATGTVGTEPQKAA